MEQESITFEPSLPHSPHDTLSCSEEHLLSESLLIDEHGGGIEDTKRETEVHSLEDECSNDYSNESSDFDDEFSLMEEIDVIPEEAMFSISPPNLMEIWCRMKLN
jgi:hypothetical protein